MKNGTKTRRNVATTVGIIVGITFVLAQVALARYPNPGVLPPQAQPYGMSYGEWSTRWWQYVFGLPAIDHPLNDETGERCAVGQMGPVFLLVGPPTTGGPVTRTECEVPAGKSILFPIINVACAVPEDGETVEDIRALCGFIADLFDPETLSVEVDGVALQGLGAYRFHSPVFAFTGAMPSVYFPDGCDFPLCYEGFHDSAVADGFWIFLAPLSVGQHTIRFHGEAPAFDFVVDVAYDLSVVPRKP